MLTDIVNPAVEHTLSDVKQTDPKPEVDVEAKNGEVAK